MAVSTFPVAEVEVSIPIEFLVFPRISKSAPGPPPEALVRVRGPERVIHDMRPQEVHVEVHLAGVKPGKKLST